MSGYPIGPELCNGTSYGSATGLFVQGGTAVAPSATANTKGSWVQLGTTTYDADFIEIRISMNSSVTNNFDALFDFGIGASGSQVVVFGNILLATSSSFSTGTTRLLLPCSIPAGSKIWGRSQADVASATTVYAVVNLYQSGYVPPGGAFGLDAIGVNTATTRGTSVAAGNAAVGSWVQIGTATVRDYSGLMLIPDIGTYQAAQSSWMVDIGIGVGGSQKIIIPQVYLGGQAANAATPLYPVPIAAGTTLWARADDVNSGSGDTFGIALYGVYA